MSTDTPPPGSIDEALARPVPDLYRRTESRRPDPVALGRSCSYCKAEPGEPCRSRDGSRYITLVGTPKFHAKRGGGAS